MENFTTSLSGIVWLVLGFGFIIFVHELGHFVAAKAVGIKVTQFAIGFGHAILTWRKGMGFGRGSSEKEFARQIEEHLRQHAADADAGDEPEYSSQDIDRAADALGLGETEYRLNWMPLGGYVKMLGQEDLDATAISDDPRSFNAKSARARACVISAGVAMNLVFGLMFFIIAFSYGVRFPKPLVGNVRPGSPAALAYAHGHEKNPAYRGLRVGDRVTAIDGKPVEDFMDIAASTLLARRGSRLQMTIQRPGQPGTLAYEVQPKVDPESGLLSIGIDTPVTLTIERLAERSSLYEAGVRPDMTIAAVQGQPIEAFHEYYRVVTDAAGKPLTTTFTSRQTGESVTTTLKAIPELTRDDDDRPNIIGLIPATLVYAFPGQKDPDQKTPAQEAGMAVGDLVAQAGDAVWPTPAELVEQVRAAARKKQPLTITVSRGGQIVQLGTVQPDRDGHIGIYPRLALDLSVVGQTLPGSPAAALNLTSGSRIDSVNGEPIASWADLQRLLQAAVANATDADESVTAAIGYEVNVKGKPKGSGRVVIEQEAKEQLAAAAWDQPIPVFFLKLDRVLVKADSPMAAIDLGFEKTVQFVIQTYVTIARLFQGTVGITDLRGPVGIIHIGTKIAGERWTYMLFFFGLISVNLVVINFLPIPIVDGGLMVFLIVEKLKGSPVSPKILSAVNMAGLIMLGCLFLTLTYFDVTRWVTGN